MRRRVLRAVPVALLAGLGLLLVLELSASRRGVALSAYLALAAAVLVLGAARVVAAALPAAGPLLGRRARAARRPEPERPAQLAWVESRVSRAFGSADGVRGHFRPLVEQIVSAELARKRGLVLETQPERAKALLGPRTGELLDGESAAAPLGVSELRLLIEEVEAI